MRCYGCGCILWRGPSELDDKPIVVIATGLRSKGVYANAKTGDVIQTWIIREDLAPHRALNQGEDFSICGDCKLRMNPDTRSRGCYVNLGYVSMIFDAYQRGVYRRLPQIDWRHLFATRALRLGAYGDPAAVPISVWWSIVDNAKHWFGYTHQWRWCDPNFRELVMASCDTPEEREEARALGWRTFRTRFQHERLGEREIACPASPEAGVKTNCDKCQLCNGSRGINDRRRDIAIVNHGWSASTSGYAAARRRESLRLIQGVA